MDIDIPDDALRVLCEQQRLAVKKLGKPCGRKLRSRLADLMAAADVRELVAGHTHPLIGNRQVQFAVSLHGGVRLVFEPNHSPVLTLPDGGVEWAAETRIKIIFIGDYHD